MYIHIWVHDKIALSGMWDPNIGHSNDATTTCLLENPKPNVIQTQRLMTVGSRVVLMRRKPRVRNVAEAGEDHCIADLLQMISLACERIPQQWSSVKNPES